MKSIWKAVLQGGKGRGLRNTVINKQGAPPFLPLAFLSLSVGRLSLFLTEGVFSLDAGAKGGGGALCLRLEIMSADTWSRFLGFGARSAENTPSQRGARQLLFL